ncbi:hypothetical protein MRB53_001809 [Persea americana]|uniref:Uncharacterized protein n=1 Tax=Persea americana TaxID=3435 RepID=A0ACC2MTN9_PERAE|nr:hypothetical protein MRB53_001809 [Persea americana]
MLEAELHALLEGLTICSKLNLKQIIIEGDCLTIGDSLQRYGNLSWSCMIQWKKVILTRLKVQWWEARHCKRTANIVADILSKMDFPMPHIFPVFLPQAARAVHPGLAQCYHLLSDVSLY